MSAIDAEFRETQPNLAVTPEASPLAIPIVTPDEARRAMQLYLELCESVLTPDDYQEFEQWDSNSRKKVKKRFKKKSAVKKLQTFYNLTVEIVREVKDELPDNHYAFRVTARATSPSGKYAESSAACTSLEERFDINRKPNEVNKDFEYRKKKAASRAYHDILATAQTRASNRAVMDCLGLGGGEVTAEEMQTLRHDVETLPPTPPAEPVLTKAQALKKRNNELNIAMFDAAIERGVCFDRESFRTWAFEVCNILEAVPGWVPTDSHREKISTTLETIPVAPKFTEPEEASQESDYS
jgi:hypothetical protein